MPMSMRRLTAWSAVLVCSVESTKWPVSAARRQIVAVSWLTWELTGSTTWLAIVALLDIVIVVTVIALFKEFQAVAFDEEFAEVAGVPVEPVFLGLLALTALAIVTLIRVVGVILAIALLTVPAVIARQWANSLSRMMVIATLVCAACTTLGLFGSYWLSAAMELSVPPGPLTILIAAGLYGLSSIAVRAGGRRA